MPSAPASLAQDSALSLLMLTLESESAELLLLDDAGVVLAAWPETSLAASFVPSGSLSLPQRLPQAEAAILANALASRQPFTATCMVEQVPVLIHGRPLPAGLAPPACYACWLRPNPLADARAELQAREALLEAERQTLRQEQAHCKSAKEVLTLAKVIVEKSPVVLFRRLNDAQSTLVYVSENIQRFGYAAREFLEGRREFADIVHPDDRERLHAEIQAYADAGQLEYTQEYRLLSPDGTVFWVHDETLAERDGAGHITHYQGILMDVTARRQAEEALRQANFIVERSPVILFKRRAGAAGLTYVSQNVSRYGYDPEALRTGALAFMDIVHPDDREDLQRQVREAAAEHKDEYRMRYRVRTAAGEERWIDDVTTVDRDEHGAPRHYQGVLADVTEQVRAEEALRQANVIVEQSPIILFKFTFGSPGLDYVSQNVSRYGYDPEDLRTGRLTFADLVHPDDRAELDRQVQTALAARQTVYSKRYRILTSRGEERWIEGATTVDYDDEGAPRHYQGVLADITERVRAKEALHKSEEKYRRILETAAEGFIMMDEDLHLTYCNDAYASMIGYAPEDLIGRRPHEWSTPEFRSFLTANRERLLAQERRSFEGALVARDGTVVPVLVHGNSLRDAHGAFLHNIAFVADITEQKKALALAEEVQRSLLPAAPPVRRGLEVAGRMTPSESIGGDYYDYFDLPSSYPGWLGVVVGDIAGHGVDAALLMTTARAFLRQRVQRPGELAEMMMDLNRALVEDMADSGRFMTCFQLLIDCCEHEPDTMGRLHWVRAGHDPALLYDPQADCFAELDGPGLPLGILDDFPFESRALDVVKPGMLIAVGTDGIWEAMDTQGRLYGKERFKDVLRRHHNQPATDIVEAVFQDLGAFCQGVRFQDDVTLVIIKLVGEPDHD
ncbi:PP2C family protein-serine/threonine phosphatase [Megalodesulfovibrio paquesii]